MILTNIKLSSYSLSNDIDADQEAWFSYNWKIWNPWLDPLRKTAHNQLIQLIMCDQVTNWTFLFVTGDQTTINDQ